PSRRTGFRGLQPTVAAVADRFPGPRTFHAAAPCAAERLRERPWRVNGDAGGTSNARGSSGCGEGLSKVTEGHPLPLAEPLAADAELRRHNADRNVFVEMAFDQPPFQR